MRAERLTDVEAVTTRVLSLAGELDRPPLVGISGFGGAGKSTLADSLSERVPGAVVVGVDDFLRVRPAVERSEDWSIVDRPRLLEQVLTPGSRGEAVAFQTYDWEAGAPGPWTPLAEAATVIVEGIGLFHPDLTGHFDLRIWVDVDLDTATAQGKWRDTHINHNPQTELWDTVWKPNDADFDERFRPAQQAHILYRRA